WRKKPRSKRVSYFPPSRAALATSAGGLKFRRVRRFLFGRLCRQRFRPDWRFQAGSVCGYSLTGRQQIKKLVGHHLLAFRGPVTAGRCSRVERRAVKTDEWDAAVLQVLDEFLVFRLKADEKLRAIRGDKLGDLVDQPLGRIRDIQLRIADLDVNGD